MELKQLEIPLLKADDLATYGEVAGMYGRGQEARKIPLEKIVVRTSFNGRTNFGDIQSLADYLLSGGKVPPITVDVLKDGTCVLLEGERRVRAHKLLFEQGHEEFNIIHAFIAPRTLSEQERVLKSISSNNNKQFEPLELAEEFKKLRDVYGMSNADIARGTGHNVMHVSNQLRLAGITDEEKNLIREGAVSATAVLDLVKKISAPSARLDAIKEAAGSGEKKLKVKDVEILGDLKAKSLEPTDTPQTLIKGLLIHVKALDRLIGTDSKMSDITFKIDAELRMLKTLIETKYIPAGESNFIIKDASALNSETDHVGLDPLFAEAAYLFFAAKIVSESLLQRKLKIVYGRATRLMAQLEQYKIIGPFSGTKPRELLFTDMNELVIAVTFIIDTQDEQPF